MTSKVLVTISGLQFDVDGESPLELVTVGSYYKRNTKHYVVFEECDTDSKEETKTVIKISENQVNVIRSGANNVNMEFETDKKNMTFYETPYGEILMGLNTLKIDLKEQENELEVMIDYSLEINYTHVSDCRVIVNVRAKEDKHA